MNTPPTSEILNLAADLIEQRGHAIGVGWDEQPHGRLCLEGGIMAAAGIGYGDNARGITQVASCPAYQAVRDYLAGPLNPRDWPLYLWQDLLIREWDDEGYFARKFVGGSREAAEAYAAEQVIATLRAVAVIEAAREAAPAEVTA